MAGQSMSSFHLDHLLNYLDNSKPNSTIRSEICNLRAFIQSSLEQHQLEESFGAEQIIAIAYSYYPEEDTPNSIPEIHLAWLKTKCLDVIKDLNQQRTNRQQFEEAIQALFDVNNPDAHSFCANVLRTLYQFRLSSTYEVKEIIAEAYNRGIKYIESGNQIHIPLAWLRITCLNVIREFRQKQDKADKPRIDSDGFTPNDALFSDLILAEDRKAIRLALTQLSPEEIQLLFARIVKCQSWQEIGRSLSAAGTASSSANTLRQRGYRALQKLRQHYDSIRPEVQMTTEDVELPEEWHGEGG